MEFTGSALTRMLDNYISGTWKVILTDASDFSMLDPTMLQVVQKELINSSSYARLPFAPDAATFDAAQLRAETPTVSVLLSNPEDATTISYDRLVIISDAPLTANLPASAIDAAANTISFAAPHGLSANDVVIVTARAGGTVPPELLNAGSPRLLYVVNPTSTTIQLSLTLDGAAINFSAAVLPVDVRFASGNVEAVEETGSLQLLPGTSRTYQIPINLGKSSANVTAP